MCHLMLANQKEFMCHLKLCLAPFSKPSFLLLSSFMLKLAHRKRKQLFILHSLIFFLLFLIFKLFFFILVFSFFFRFSSPSYQFFLPDSQPDRLSSLTDRAVQGPPGCPLSYTDGNSHIVNTEKQI